jgi:alkaline phosphatase D
LLRAAGALGLAASTSPVLARPRLDAYPFTLGVASGYPTPSSLVLWTRLAPQPLAPGGGLRPGVLPVRWELAHDPGFRRPAASGTVYTQPEWAHTVHVEPHGLEPHQEYCYRFHVGDATSPVGRTRTAPTADRTPARLRLGVGSCQHYAQGWFGAYRHVVADTLDLFLHVGDYIYESSWGDDLVRSQGAQEPVTLDDYRRFYALYRTDPDLQAAHASCPWAVVWDDHEVDNDYAGAISQDNDKPAWFLARRAAAYRAYYEHMPLPRTMVPFGHRTCACIPGSVSAGSRSYICSTIASTAASSPARNRGAPVLPSSATVRSGSTLPPPCSVPDRSSGLQRICAHRQRCGTCSANRP